MAAAYHMEALRKQRIIERKQAALARIAICQVGILSCEAFSAVSCDPCLWCLTGIFITFWWMFGVKIIPHLCFTFLTLVHNCIKWAGFLISLEY